MGAFCTSGIIVAPESQPESSQPASSHPASSQPAPIVDTTVVTIIPILVPMSLVPESEPTTEEPDDKPEPILEGKADDTPEDKPGLVPIPEDIRQSTE